MPPHSRKQSGPVPVESITHDAKRVNLPTADAQEYVTESVKQARSMLVQRDVTQDPQLVWRGKYGDGRDPSHLETEDDLAGAAEFEVEAPPIYIQEKIDPRVLIENLRNTAKAGEPEPELGLFDTFDGLGELDLVDFYSHSANWSNRMILGDSLQVMASLTEREDLRGQVQMIYIDPPYGIKFGSNWQASARSRDVKDGKDAVREAEQIKAFRDTWELGIHSYLSYLRDRLLVARELLTESGSCFVQIGDENVHLVRSLMDEVFGRDNFLSLVTAQKTSSSTGAGLGAVTDYLLWFAKNSDVVKYHPLFRDKEFGGAGSSNYSLVELADGTRRKLTAAEKSGSVHLPADSRPYAADNLTSQSMGREKGEGAASWFKVDVGAQEFDPGPRSRWKTNETGMSRLLAASRAEPAGNRLAYVRYIDDFPAYPLNNIWTDTVSSFMADKLYVVQTNVSIVERCMLMCTDPGDLVIDPTCGSGTTAYVAEQWGRRWITIDTSRVALALARQRIMGARFPYYLIADSPEGRAKESEITGKPTDPSASTAGDIRQGFVYERVQHITLKSIANNPDIREGMSRKEIDASIKRHADFELLYDKPYEDKNVVRVAGPFTVESLSPRRSLAFAGGPDAGGHESISERLGAEQPDSPNFEQSVLQNLAKAGIQNGRLGERLRFETVEPHAGQYIQAVAVQAPAPRASALPAAAVGAMKAANGNAGSGSNGAAPVGSGSQALSASGGAPHGGDVISDSPAQLRVGVAIGPQYGIVSQEFARDAVREAVAAGDIDLLCILAFAFDPTVVEITEQDGVTVDASRDGFANVAGERTLGKVRLLFVKMNVDLLMGDALKKTGAGNLFTVFGEPDIDLDRNDAGDVVVTLNGVDVYDPTTGEVRSRDTDRIALWMIDTNYDGDSFFVRHCYFTGGGDPYKRLKTALRAEIDADAWASLYSTVSRPFAPPETGQIAVKVINDYGDEVMKVFEVT